MQDVSYNKPLILSVKFPQLKSENEPRVKSWLSAPNTIRIEKNLSKFSTRSIPLLTLMERVETISNLKSYSKQREYAGGYRIASQRLFVS